MATKQYVNLEFDIITILYLHVINLGLLLLPPLKEPLWYIAFLYLANMVGSDR